VCVATVGGVLVEFESPAVELTAAFARVQGLLLETPAATAAVTQLAEVARVLVPMATGAGVTLIDEHGHPATTAATDPAVEALDRLQYESGEGPCLTAWDTVSVQRVDDTATETRWPAWTKAAVATGVGSVLSVPLVYRAREIGAIKVYAGEPYAFTEHEEHLLGLLAGAAATLLGAAQDPAATRRLSAGLKADLADRQTVQIAVGILMERHHLDRATAHMRLVTSSRLSGIPLLEVVLGVVEHAEDPRR
jgi:GAF domain-containing protein